MPKIWWNSAVERSSKKGSFLLVPCTAPASWSIPPFKISMKLSRQTLSHAAWPPWRPSGHNPKKFSRSHLPSPMLMSIEAASLHTTTLPTGCKTVHCGARKSNPEGLGILDGVADPPPKGEEVTCGGRGMIAESSRLPSRGPRRRKRVIFGEAYRTCT